MAQARPAAGLKLAQSCILQLTDKITLMALDGCSVCEAQIACLSYAQAANERKGNWGATLPEERAASRRGAAA